MKTINLVAAVAAGYLVMAVAIMVIFAAAYPILGVERLFAPGTYDAAPGWIVLSFAVGLLAAMAGGWVSARIAPRKAAPLSLAGLVLVLGTILAIPALGSGDPARGGPRPAGVTMSDAMTRARQPAWVAVANPFVGAIGVLLGASYRRLRR